MEFSNIELQARLVVLYAYMHAVVYHSILICTSYAFPYLMKPACIVLDADVCQADAHCEWLQPDVMELLPGCCV